MLVTQDKLKEMIRLGGDSRIGFLQTSFNGCGLDTPEKNMLAREIAAMANAKGGWLILGVEDKARQILGIPLDRLDSLERFIGEICMDTLKPPLPVDMFRRELPNEAGDLVPLLLVRIEESLYVHQAPDGFFYRVGSRAQPMATDFVLRLYQERSLAKIKRFEEMPVPRSSGSDLGESLWRRFVSNHEENPEAALLKRDLLVVNTDGDTQASVLGILMCSENPRRFFPERVHPSGPLSWQGSGLKFSSGCERYFRPAGPSDSRCFGVSPSEPASRGCEGNRA